MSEEIIEVQGEDVLLENKGEIAIVINPADYGIAVDKASVIENSFLELSVERNSLRDEYAQIMKQGRTLTSCKQAKELSKRVGKNRTKTMATYKVEKEVYLRGGQFIDALRNRDIKINTNMEEKLDEFAEHFEKIEADRLIQLAADRDAELRKYTEVIPAALGTMMDDVYEFYLTSAKKSFEDKAELDRLAEVERIAKELADQIEADRLAEVAAQEKVAADKKQAELEAELAAAKIIADKKEAELAIERKAAADLLKKQQDDAAEVLRIANEKANAILVKEQEKQKAAEKVAADLLAAEKVKSDKLKADLAKAEVDRVAENNKKIIADGIAKAAADKLLAAPRKEKLTTWVDGFKMTAPTGAESDIIALDIISKFDGFKKWANDQINKL